MSDATARLKEAKRVFDRLELQVEQYRIHLEELTAQPYEAERAQTVLGDMVLKLRSQRTYCDLLRNAVQADAPDVSSSWSPTPRNPRDLTAKASGSRRARRMCLRS
jgi:hypothetical protein